MNDEEKKKPGKRGRRPKFLEYGADDIYHPPPTAKERALNKPVSTKRADQRELEREAVILMSGAGIPHNVQAKILKIGIQTLNRNFQEELDHGEHMSTSKVATKLFQKCMEGNVSAIIFYLKARAGWKEADKLEITGKDGVPLMSKTERDQRIASVLLKGKHLLPRKSGQQKNELIN